MTVRPFYAGVWGARFRKAWRARLNCARRPLTMLCKTPECRISMRRRFNRRRTSVRLAPVAPIAFPRQYQVMQAVGFFLASYANRLGSAIELRFGAMLQIIARD